LPGKKITVDPGHGGDDAGNVSPSGEVEGDIAFHLAASVARMLEAEGATAVLTRGPNDGPSLSERAAIANEFVADLFISIHLNAHSSEAAHGAATYYFEHGGVASEPGEHLAELVGASLVAAGRTDCRAHGRNYLILRETLMPALVVEPCFITNPEEAKLLADPAGVERISSALVEGIHRYFSEP
jgi:N-acetylmuramoyl-L-alanine amidase